MAIASGSLIEATDFSNLAGVRASNTAFPNEASAVARINAIYGVGYGDRGYGQASPFINGVARNSLVLASDWQGLLSAVQTCVSHLGLPISNFPSSSFYAANSVVTANNYDWANTIGAVDQARLNASSSSLGQYVAVSDTRTALWTEKPGLTVEIDFATEDAARWFFNSGGKIVINSTFSAGTTNPQDLSWQQLLNQDAGTISIGAYTTTRTGGNPSQGIVSSTVGYYNLTSSADEAFVIQPTSGLFAANSYSILVQREGFQGNNGGNGSRVLINVFFDDQYGTSAQPVTGTLTANIIIEKAVSPLVVANPVTTVIQDLNGGGGQVFFSFVDTLSSNINNYNLLTRAQIAAAAANPPVSLDLIPLRATVVVNTGVIVGSNSSSNAAITVPTLLAGSTVSIVNNGFVVGKGGDGGAGWSWWPPGNRDGQNGGPAIDLSWPVTLLNYGTIGGGGGGGGGSNTSGSSQTYDDPGGSGGGGAGQQGGSPGNVGPVPSYWGEPGSLTTGGAGGFPSPNGRSREWGAGFVGGRGGDLGQPGQAGSGDYGSSVGGSAGAAVIGSSNILSGSINGTIIGSLL